MIGTTGTVIDGRIEIEATDAPLPEGLKVWIDGVVPPPEETYEEHLANLRESLEESKQGKTRPAREVLKAMALRHGLPLEPGE